MSGCTAASCIDSAAAAWLFGLPMTCFAVGYGIGKLLHLVQKMYDAA